MHILVHCTHNYSINDNARQVCQGMAGTANKNGETVGKFTARALVSILGSALTKSLFSFFVPNSCRSLK